MSDKNKLPVKDTEYPLREEIPELDLTPSPKPAAAKFVEETHPIKLKDIEQLVNLSDAISRDCTNLDQVLGRIDITTDRQGFEKGAEPLSKDVTALGKLANQLAAPKEVADSWKEIKDIAGNTQTIELGLEDLLHHTSLNSQDPSYVKGLTNSIVENCKDLSDDLGSFSMNDCFNPTTQEKVAKWEDRLKSTNADETKVETLLKIISTKVSDNQVDGIGKDVDRLLSELGTTGTDNEWMRSLRVLYQCNTQLREAGKLPAEESILRKVIDRKELSSNEKMNDYSSLIANLKAQGKDDLAAKTQAQALESVPAGSREAVKRFDILTDEIEKKLKAGKINEACGEINEASECIRKNSQALGIPLLNEAFQRIKRCVDQLPQSNANTETLLAAVNMYGVMNSRTISMDKEITSKHSSRTVKYDFTWYGSNYMQFVDKCANAMAKKEDWQSAAKLYDLEFNAKLGDCLKIPTDGPVEYHAVIYRQEGNQLFAYSPPYGGTDLAVLMHKQAQAHLKTGDIQGAEQIEQKALEVAQYASYSNSNDKERAESAELMRDTLNVLQDIYSKEGRTGDAASIAKRAAKEERIRLKAEIKMRGE